MWNWIGKLEEIRSTGQPAVLVTVVHTEGSAPREPGAKMLVLEDGQFFGTIGGGRLEKLALDDAKDCLNGGPSVRTVRYPLAAKAGQCCGGSMELLMEAIGKTPNLYLYGAGHVGQAVCKTLVGTPFQVHVVDTRPEWIGSKDLPQEVVRHEKDWEDFNDDAIWDGQNTYVAIMTHQHDLDQEILADVLKRQTRYLGLIGSTAKWKRFTQRLQAQGVTQEDLKQVHCPIGTPLGGGKAPQEVAISVATQLLQEFYGD